MKHKLLTHGTSHGTPLINDSARVTEQLVVTEYQDEAGTYRYTQKTVVAKLPDGSERDLLEVLTNVMNFWEHYMETIGIVPVARNFTYDGNVRARSRAECQPNRLDFEVVQGQRFHQTMRFLRWDHKSGKAVPIDLTASKISFRMYAPKYDIELTLKHELSGKEFKTTISLTEEESLLLSRMSNDVERQLCIDSLPSAQAALQQLAIEAGLQREPPK